MYVERVRERLYSIVLHKHTHGTTEPWNSLLKTSPKPIILKRALHLVKSLPRHFIHVYIDYNDQKSNSVSFFLEISVIVTSLRLFFF